MTLSPYAIDPDTRCTRSSSRIDSLRRKIGKKNLLRNLNTHKNAIQIRTTRSREHITGCCPFTLHSFKLLLTLSSEYFATFPHGTCSLSVSHRYLALDEIYHLSSAWTFDHTYSRKTFRTHRIPSPRREFHPLCCSLPGDLG